jgi:hypothetical protein
MSLIFAHQTVPHNDRDVLIFRTRSTRASALRIRLDGDFGRTEANWQVQELIARRLIRVERWKEEPQPSLFGASISGTALLEAWRRGGRNDAVMGRCSTFRFSMWKAERRRPILRLSNTFMATCITKIKPRHDFRTISERLRRGVRPQPDRLNPREKAVHANWLFARTLPAKLGPMVFFRWPGLLTVFPTWRILHSQL